MVIPSTTSAFSPDALKVSLGVDKPSEISRIASNRCLRPREERKREQSALDSSGFRKVGGGGETKKKKKEENKIIPGFFILF